MKSRHLRKKLFLSLLIFVFSFILFSLPVIAATDNDIDFDWISSDIYNVYSPDLYSYSNVSHTIYNNTDYFEHIYDFDDTNYTNDDFINYVYNFAGGVETGITRLYDNYYIAYINDYVKKYDLSFNEIEEMNNSDYNIAINNYDMIKDITSDDNYFYVLVGNNIYDGGGFPAYLEISILVYDLDFNFVQYLIQDYQIDNLVGLYDIYKGGITYYDDSIYYICVLSSVETVVQFDKDNGTIIDTYDVSGYVDQIGGIGVYDDYFYLGNYDGGGNVEIYDNAFTHIESKDDIGYHSYDYIYTFFIDDYNDLVYYVSAYSSYIYVCTIDFLYYNEYSFNRYFPDDFGLTDAITNLNTTMYFNTSNNDYINSNLLYHYNASYSFYDDIDGNDPIGWIDSSGSGCSVNVVSNYLLHNKVIKLSDYSSTYQAYIHTDVNNIEYGTIEYWMCSNDCTKYNDCGFIGNANFYFLIYQDKFQYYDGSYHQITTKIIPEDNQWYHIRIDFDCTSGGYLGLLADKVRYTINDLDCGDYSFNTANDYIDEVRFKTTTATSSWDFYIDGIGFSWLDNYTIENNRYDVSEINFHNEILFMNETYDNILSIDCYSGIYTYNDINCNFSIYENVSNYWSINIQIDQILYNSTLYIYNETNGLITSFSFDNDNLGNIKYIKYIQYSHTDNPHYIYISNFSIESNSTAISGKKGFLSYLLDDVNWNSESNGYLTIYGYGNFRLYVSNTSYINDDSLLYIVSGYNEYRDDYNTFDLSYLDFNLINPYLIIESVNGFYLLDRIQIYGIDSQYILYDDRENVYLGSLSYSNVDTDDSNFHIDDGKLYFDIIYDDDNLEFIQLTFDIDDITALNYKFIYGSYLNDSSTTLINQIKVKYSDATFTSITIPYLYTSDIEILEQDRTVSQIIFLISDDDKYNNNTISGYFDGFYFDYSEQISISFFIENMLIMVIPFIIILSLTFSITIVLRKRNTKEKYNKSAFFPVFLLSSIIVFILGFFDSWVLFSIVISAIVYIITKRSEL